MLYFQQKLCFLDLIKFDFLLVVICLFDQSLWLYNGIIGDQTLTYWRSLIICKSQGNDPDADNLPFSLRKEAWRWTACDEISVLATLIVLVAPMVIFLDKHGLNAFLKPFMLVFNEWGTYARLPRLLSRADWKYYNITQIAQNLLSHMFFNVKLNFKMGLFSSIFWYEDSFLCKIALFVLVTFTFWNQG